MHEIRELIEETGKAKGLGFDIYFWPASDKFESWKKIHKFDEIMTQLPPFWIRKFTLLTTV